MPTRHIYNNAEYYRRRAYDFHLKYPYFEALAKILFDRYAPKSVIDVGCAKGFFVYAFRELGVDAFGVDISQYAIDHSLKKIRVYLKNANVEVDRLPFGNSQADMVTSMECMEHLQKPQHTITEIARILKPGGLVAIGVPKLRPIISSLFRNDKVLHPSHLPKKYWVKLFGLYRFDYLGDFVLSETKAVRASLMKAKRSHAYHTSPNVLVAKVLNKMWVPGRWARVQLAMFVYGTDYLLFRRRNATD